MNIKIETQYPGALLASSGSPLFAHRWRTPKNYDSLQCSLVAAGQPYSS
jgi:hypothetical protein